MYGQNGRVLSAGEGQVWSLIFDVVEQDQVLGQEVATLVDETKEPGYYTVTWDASQMASGVYFYRLTAGDYSETRRMIRTKSRGEPVCSPKC